MASGVWGSCCGILSASNSHSNVRPKMRQKGGQQATKTNKAPFHRHCCCHSSSNNLMPFWHGAKPLCKGPYWASTPGVAAQAMRPWLLEARHKQQRRCKQHKVPQVLLARGAAAGVVSKPQGKRCINCCCRLGSMWCCSGSEKAINAEAFSRDSSRCSIYGKSVSSDRHIRQCIIGDWEQLNSIQLPAQLSPQLRPRTMRRSASHGWCPVVGLVRQGRFVPPNSVTRGPVPACLGRQLHQQQQTRQCRRRIAKAAANQQAKFSSFSRDPAVSIRQSCWKCRWQMERSRMGRQQARQ